MERSSRSKAAAADSSENGGIMRCERTLVGVCLKASGLMFSACASGAQVAATGPDQASDATAAYDVAEAVPRAEQRPSPPAPNTPPVFPPNYRSRIALELIGEYAAKGKGPPVITEPRMRPITYQGERVSVCVDSLSPSCTGWSTGPSCVDG